MGRRALGWLHMERGVPLAELRLAHVLPSSDRGGVAVAFDYVQWLVTERNISAFTQGGPDAMSFLLSPHSLSTKHDQSFSHTPCSLFGVPGNKAGDCQVLSFSAFVHGFILRTALCVWATPCLGML